MARSKTLSVWAPDAVRVDLVLTSGRVAMQPAEHRWWTSPAPVPAGSDYLFSIDGGDPLPDPRSFGDRTLACNLGPRTQRVPLDPGVEIVLASENSVRLVANGVKLPSDSVAILGRATSR